MNLLQVDSLMNYFRSCLKNHFQESVAYLEELIPPVLSCFYDQDSRVRYYACEALYNISKVARGAVLPFFNKIFDGLSKVWTQLFFVLLR